MSLMMRATEEFIRAALRLCRALGLTIGRADIGLNALARECMLSAAGMHGPAHSIVSALSVAASALRAEPTDVPALIHAAHRLRWAAENIDNEVAAAVKDVIDAIHDAITHASSKRGQK